MRVDLRKKEMTSKWVNRLQRKQPVKPPELNQILIHRQKSELDDIVLDEDYRPEKDGRPDSGSDTDTAQHSEGETGAAPETSAVQRHRRPRPDMWRREVIKEKRLKVESYKNKVGQERAPKTMGTSQQCLKSKKQSCELLTEEERTDIFNNFWSMPSWETRKLYIQTLVENVPIKQKKGGVQGEQCPYHTTCNWQIDVNYLCVRILSVQHLALPPGPLDHG
jgi:hypothetical protein